MILIMLVKVIDSGNHKKYRGIYTLKVLCSYLLYSSIITIRIGYEALIVDEMS